MVRLNQGLPVRGRSQLIILLCGSPLGGIRSVAFLAKELACSSLCRLSFGSDIHSRMIFRRASCSGFMFKSYGSNLGRRCRCLKLIVPVPLSEGLELSNCSHAEFILYQLRHPSH